MHVLLVCRSFPHHRAGGMEWHAQDIAEGLMAAGHTVSAITTPLPSRPALKALSLNGDIVQLGAQPGAYGLRFAIDFLRRARGAAWQLAPDAIHAQGFAGVAAHALLSGIAPVATTVHGTLWSETPLATARPTPALVRRYWHRFAFALPWALFLNGRSNLAFDSLFSFRQAQLDAHAVLRARGRRLARIPLGFDMARFPLGDRDAARAAWGADPGDFLAAGIGRLEEVKGAATAFDAFCALAKSHPRARLVLAGDGELLQKLRRRAARFPFADRISFPGRIAPGRVPQLLQAADVFLNADRGYPAFGLANAEALAMGTRVLASDRGAHPEVVRAPLDGELLPADDLDAWIEALRAAARFEDTGREARAASARRRFARGRMIKRLVAFYESIR